MVIVSKYHSTCAMCSGLIRPGDRINWARGMRATHEQCPTAKPAPEVTAAPPTPPPAPKLAVPTLHLNGSYGPDLCRAYQDAVSAVYAALNVVAQSAPHGRDYYPQGDGALRQAQAQHDARLGHLRQVADELCAILNDVETACAGAASIGTLPPFVRYQSPPVPPAQLATSCRVCADGTGDVVCGACEELLDDDDDRRPINQQDDCPI